MHHCHIKVESELLAYSSDCETNSCTQTRGLNYWIQQQAKSPLFWYVAI